MGSQRVNAVVAPGVRRGPFLIALLGLAALNVLLFIPGFATLEPRPALTPFFPTEHPHGPYGFDLRSVWEYVKALGLRRANLDPFRLSIELCLLTAVALWWPKARWLRRLTAGWYGLTLLLLTYHHVFQGFFLRPAALWEDWRLLRNLFHYVTDQWSWRLAGLVVGGAAAWALLMVALSLALGTLCHGASRVTRLAALALTLYGLGLLAWFGPSRGDPVSQLVSRPLAENLRVSLVRKREFEALAEGDPDPRYLAFSKVRLARKPNVALMMLEAYGELAVACDTGPAYRVLMQRMEQRLERSGYHVRSAWSRAPVYGGQSWLSIASVQLGMRVDTVRKYELVENESARAPSLTRFFKEQGYFTAAVQPGNNVRTGLKKFDPYNRELVIDAPELNYTGLRYGWQGIPDQYTLGLIGELLPTLRQPWLLFSMSVSTHHPWDAPFVYVNDWRALQDPALDTASVAAPWDPIEEKAGIGEERRGYFRTVEYEWRGLAQLMESETRDDTVFILLGDHQPKLPCDGGKAVSWNTPLHVISRDAALLERFGEHGFVPGLVAPLGERPPFTHEGLFSLFLKVFTSTWGDDAQVTLDVAPEGISLGSLYR